MKQTFTIILFIFATFAIAVPAVYAQQDDEAVREQTREHLAGLLDKVGPTINVVFTRSQKQPFNYVGSLKTGLVNAESFEIVISVTPKETIGFRIYPHYKGGYINAGKLNDGAALMTLLLRLSDRAFLFWGADESLDIFTGYTFTLESGFPDEAMTVVLRSIINSDKFIGEMRPLLDAPIADVTETRPGSRRVKSTKPAPARRRRLNQRNRRRP